MPSRWLSNPLRSGTLTRVPVLVLNPRSDHSFVELVERLVGECVDAPLPDAGVTDVGALTSSASGGKPSGSSGRPAAAGGRVRTSGRKSVTAAPMDPERLLEHLRWWYPHVRVRRRSLGRQALEAWYVYRDGSWVPDGSAVAPEESVDPSEPAPSASARKLASE
jgi:hypothetical protein